MYADDGRTRGTNASRRNGARFLDARHARHCAPEGFARQHKDANEIEFEMNNSIQKTPSTGRFNIVLLLFGGIIFYFLLTEHTTHFYGALPWLFLLACPFLHRFMHSGHNHSGQHTTARDQSLAEPYANSEQESRDAGEGQHQHHVHT